MSTKIIEGQLDFLGLLSEYTDDQGATVRVREPRSRQVRPMMPKIPERIVERDTDPEQMTLEMFQILSPTEKNVSNASGTSENVTPASQQLPTMITPVMPEKPTMKAPDVESKGAVRLEERFVESPAKESTGAKEPKPVLKSETAKEPKLVSKSEASKELKPAEGFETLTKPESELKEDKVISEPVKGELLFKRCAKCWCSDCKHNARNEGVPRDICGNMMACPACDDCIRDDSATICEIGNAKEGCRLRAMEEGIITTEEN